jgi:tetratricopeptide (TPR) repeat protein
VRRTPLFVLAAILLLAGCTQRAAERPATADERVLYYSRRVARQPRLYPVHVQLAEAYFDRAGETHDPSLLKRARESVDRSLAIQPTFEAFLLQARIAAYSHRFEAALEWAARAGAAAVYPKDPAVTAVTVEALLGLGRAEEARGLLPPAGTPLTDFHTAATLGRWLAGNREFDAARDAYSRAAALALEAGVPARAAWAEVMAAGTRIDSGRPAEAEPHLRAASKLAPASPDLRLHEAEVLEATGRGPEALAVYERLHGESPDPLASHRAYLLAQRLGRRAAAETHLRDAEAGYERVIASGEIYTLGALAQLYADAGIHLERALELAQENLKYKRDPDAVATLAAVRARLGGPTGRKRSRCSTSGYAP